MTTTRKRPRYSRLISRRNPALFGANTGIPWNYSYNSIVLSYQPRRRCLIIEIDCRKNLLIVGIKSLQILETVWDSLFSPLKIYMTCAQRGVFLEIQAYNIGAQSGYLPNTSQFGNAGINWGSKIPKGSGTDATETHLLVIGPLNGRCKQALNTIELLLLHQMNLKTFNIIKI